jgi:hypothetical protein
MATQANLIATYQSNPTLQNRYTQQEYLDMFGFGAQQPTPTPDPDPTPTPTPPSDGIQNIIGQNLRSDGYNPYAPNPNVNTNYRPNYDFRQFSEYGINPSTMDRKQMDMNQEFFYGKPPSGLEQLANKALNFVPYIGPIKRGAEFLSGALKGVMPINQRAILENELRGSGVYTDDIGRIAIGPDGKYNTPEGIMAGYNANMMTDKTFDKRTGNISKSLQDRTSLTKDQIDAIVNEIATTGKYSGTLTDEDLGVKNLFSNLVNVNLAKFNFKNKQKKTQDIIDFQNKERERKKREKAEAEMKARQADTTRRARAANPDVYARAEQLGFIDSKTGGFKSAGTNENFSNKTGKGRTGYDDGGRVYLYNRLK